MKEIIESIQKNLYKLSNILSTPNVIKVLENNSIDISNLKTNFDIDKIDNIKYLDNLVLDILNEKLEFFIKYSKNEFDIKHNKLELSVCLNFIENQLINNLDKNQDSKNIIDTAYLKSIKIKNYFSIKDIDIKDLNSKEIYFIGENGEGKTILLQAILLALKGKKYLKMEYIEDSLKDKIEFYSTIDKEYIKYLDVKNIFAYGINRNKIDYKNFDKNGYDGLFDTSDIRKTTLLKDPIKVLEYNHILIYDFIEKLNIIIFEEKVKVIKKKKDIIFNENG
ncbi:MAG: AAA family ATPase, partial [Patescibacteria group bacterium]|nr:AAA family ATPase [Patescibacteria group bacterium]